MEDDPFIQQCSDFTISDLGHVTLTADDLAGALAHLRGGQQVDALFVDIRLHALVLGGYEVANRAIEVQPRLRVLYTSGTPLSAGMSQLFVKGGRFLQKPYTTAELEHSVALLLQ
ncbi:MAG: response regulator [Caulobacter sp.]|nr:response regulator [Caulobacter sp.]